MTQSYDLTQMDSGSFEHMVNFIALKRLGAGVTGFASGPDGGRDGLLRGKAPYPSENECWEGVWYIQSKFHKPHLSSNEQKWLINEVKKELSEFGDVHKRRVPDIWVIATNIDASGHHQAGSYDVITNLVSSQFPNMKVDIWSGRRILDFLMEHEDIARTYGHFLTPGHVITKLYMELDKKNSITKEMISHLIAHQFKELCNTKLEQAGANGDQRQKIYDLFRDLPIKTSASANDFFVMESLVSASQNVQKISTWNNYGNGWREWSVLPQRSRIMLLKGGPGQGKSTAGQYFAQIQKAAFILSENGPKVWPQIEELAKDLKISAEAAGYWPTVPRIPIFVELKDYAKWFINQNEHLPRNIIQYVHSKIQSRTSFDSTPGMLREALTMYSWFVNFDGLDEVPNDIKDDVSNEIIEFSEEISAQLDSDILILCTTRPQGYSGQFDGLTASVCDLLPLTPEIALECASAVVKYNRSEDESEEAIQTLKFAMQSEQVSDLMTTPLQSHIMAVVVRDGGRPPEKRWELFNNFYNVMKRRESLKNFLDKKISSLLQENDQLLKAIHDRLGVSLHAKAEISTGAASSLSKSDFKILSEQTASLYLEGDTTEIVNTLMEATIERLVFVNTPENSAEVRFDVRQLQEFFAGEFVHSAVDDQEFKRRFELICGDAHWREVVHFILSALAHQKKLSTLEIASSVLQKLDTDDENHKVKIFKKRLGIGSLLTLRLLEEGVLEQDKGIRYQFTNNIQPLWNLIELPVSIRLCSLKKEQSFNWIKNSLVECFISFDFSEHILAGFYIATLIDEKHQRFNEIVTRLENAPEYYWFAIFNWFAKTRFTSNSSMSSPQHWFVKMTLRNYFSNANLSAECYSKMNRFLMIVLSKSHSAIENDSFSDEERYLVSRMFTVDEKDGEDHEEKATDDAINHSDQYCFVRPVHGKTSWSIPYEKNHYTYEFTTTKHTAPVELVKAVIVYCSSKSVDDFKKLLEMIKALNYETIHIPRELQRLIPIRFESEFVYIYVNALLNMDKTALYKYLDDKILNGQNLLIECDQLTITNTEFDEVKWSLLCKDYPLISLRIPVDSFFSPKEVAAAIKSNPVGFYAPILEIALETPEVFSHCFFMWGQIFNFYPQYQQEIRNKLVSLEPVKGIGGCYIESDNYFFKINTDTELIFLVYLINSLYSDQSLVEYGFVDTETILGSNYDEDFIKKFGLSNDMLLSYGFDEMLPKNIRVASFCLYLSQSFKNKDEVIEHFFSEKIDQVLLSLHSKESCRLITISLYLFLRSINHYDDKLINFLGLYTILIKENFNSRFLIQYIYSKWRERSSAVVHNARLLESWLNYSYFIG